jgi:hypothetical protein
MLTADLRQAGIVGPGLIRDHSLPLLADSFPPGRQQPACKRGFPRVPGREGTGNRDGQRLREAAATVVGAVEAWAGGGGGNPSRGGSGSSASGVGGQRETVIREAE